MAYAKALSVVVVAFLAFSLPPYLTGHTRVPATFALHYPLLVGHVMFAAVAMVMAVVQLSPGLRARRPALHRRCGRVYVAAAVPAALCGLVIGAATPFGPFLAVSNVVLASLWLWFTTTGYLAARQHRFRKHRRQMILSATLALSIIGNRIWTPIIFISLQPSQNTAAGLGAWLGWTIPFFTVRRWLDRQPAIVS
ncbi:DUF2306 domain-containing protein [Mycolicibacterium sphagni]|uniref:DUF2306 domain-containing protein n=1 Tax=Mycolicibacterium sphagni TaxID=1786 RepID=A0ABX2KB92_9MYCO|nr:DUF2306 domain-containing protein [Mycolicibacterium sphagni]NTY63480.1 DUF2306 domain-containing protein [Mycolicibacterium sphagni]